MAMITNFGNKALSPTPERGTIQRWNTPGYRHCQETDQQGNTRTWLSKEPSWDWVETTQWKTAGINKEEQ